jgi:hypothetical protein
MFRKLPFLLLGWIMGAAALCETDVSAWYRGNTHTHSLWSDGNDFPEMIVDWYQRHHYDFIALSDHDILAEGAKMRTPAQIKARQKSLGHDAITKCEARFGKEWVERKMVGDQEMIVLKTLAQFRGLFEKPGEFYIMTAEEISGTSATGPVHINALNLKTKIPSIRDKTLDTREVMRRTLRVVAEQAEKEGIPIITHLNHPNFQWAVTAQDLAAVTEERFFEVYNGHPNINHLGKEGAPGDEKIWDIANTVRLGEMGALPLFGVATDDAHTYHGEDVSPGRGWIKVGAEKLDGASIVKAMVEGRFYASTGVSLATLDFDSETRTLSLSIQPKAGATFTTQFIGTKKGSTQDIAIGEVFSTVTGERASCQVPEGALYLRATVTSSQGHDNPSFKDQKQQAWVQPVGWQ